MSDTPGSISLFMLWRTQICSESPLLRDISRMGKEYWYALTPSPRKFPLLSVIGHLMVSVTTLPEGYTVCCTIRLTLVNGNISVILTPRD